MRTPLVTGWILGLGAVAIDALTFYLGEPVLAVLLLFSQTTFLTLSLPLQWSEGAEEPFTKAKKALLAIFAAAAFGGVAFFANTEFSPSNWSEVSILSRSVMLSMFVILTAGVNWLLIAGSLVWRRGDTK